MVTAFWKMTSWCSLIGSHHTWWHSYSRCWEPQIICCDVCLYTYLKQYVAAYTKANGKAVSIQACYRPWGFQEVQISRFEDNQHMKLVRLTAQCTSCPYPYRKFPGTCFCWRLSQRQSHSVAGRILSMKNSSDTIRNQTHDLLACSAVFQPTAPLCAPCTSIYQLKKSIACTAKFL